jgi:uncharacterized protein YdeI (YjbR/CyaY-like superfamily)
MNPVFFAAPSDLRAWFEKNHATSKELWVGYYKKGTGKPSVTWPESVNEALCYGWIDGIRKSIDATSYMIRFTPRKSGSIWSAVNVRNAQGLIEKGRMQPAGLKAYEARPAKKSGVYSYEQPTTDLAEPYNRLLKKDNRAWDFFQAQPPYRRKAIVAWIMSAKKEETRLKRLEKLRAHSTQGQTLPELTSPKRVRPDASPIQATSKRSVR